MNDTDKFRVDLKILMKRTGLTQEQIAQDMGYGPTYISEMLGPNSVVSRKFLNAFYTKYDRQLRPGDYDEMDEYEQKLSDKESPEYSTDVYKTKYIGLLERSYRTMEENNRTIMDFTREVTASLHKIVEKLDHPGNADGRTTATS